MPYSPPQRRSSKSAPTSKSIPTSKSVPVSSGAWFRPASSSYSSSSHAKRRPRDGYIRRLIHKLKKLLLEFFAYARRHPIKVLFPILMTLISGGALHSLAKSLGFRLPAALGGAGGARGLQAGYDAYYGSQSGYGASSGGFGDLESGGMLRSAMKVASAFL